MKKLLATLSLALVVTLGAVGFVGCKKTSIVGKWTFEKVEIKSSKLNNEQKQELIEMMSMDGISFEFNKDGKGKQTMTIDDQTKEMEFTWKQEGKKYIVKAAESTTQEFTFEIIKNKLVMIRNIDNVPEEGKDQTIAQYGEDFEFKIIFKK